MSGDPDRKHESARACLLSASALHCLAHHDTQSKVSRAHICPAKGHSKALWDGEWHELYFNIQWWKQSNWCDKKRGYRYVKHWAWIFTGAASCIGNCQIQWGWRVSTWNTHWWRQRLAAWMPEFWFPWTIDRPGTILDLFLVYANWRHTIITKAFLVQRPSLNRTG